MAHDPKAPRLAAVARILLGLTIGFLFVNLYFGLLNVDLPVPLSYVLTMFIIVLLGVTVWASKENPVPQLSKNPLFSDLDGAYREGKTMVGSSSTTVDIHGFEVSRQSEPSEVSASIVQSIINVPVHQDKGSLLSAIDTLSDGDVGEVAEIIATERPTLHTQISHERESVPADETTGKSVQRVVQPQIPLPGKASAPDVKVEEIPGLSTTREFVTDGISSIPLPSFDDIEIEPEQTEQSPLELPSLDDLFIEEKGQERDDDLISEEGGFIDEVLDLPDLPEVIEDDESDLRVVEHPPLDLPSLDDLDL